MTEQATIRLQAVGMVPAKRVRDFRPGDFMGWNFGFANEVQCIEHIMPTGTMGRVYFVGVKVPRLMKLDRLAAIGAADWKGGY